MGKANKKRACPAVNRDISAAECGANRLTRYACTAECSFNPFAPANYSQALEIEDRLQPKVLSWLALSLPEPDGFQSRLAKTIGRGSIHAMHALVMWLMFLERDREGLTRAERWRNAGFPGLKNDERAMLEAQMQMRVVLFEVHRIIGTEQVEVVDLFASGQPPIIIRDRRLAGMAVRFAVWLGWFFPMPHFGRNSGTAVVLPEIGGLEPLAVVTEMVKHLGGPADIPQMRLWLAQNFVRFDAALIATSYERRRLMFAGLDASYGKAVYECQTSRASIRKHLLACPEVAKDAMTDNDAAEGFKEALVWFDATPHESLVKTATRRPSLGRILLGDSHCRVEAIGKAKLSRLRQEFEQLLGTSVKFSGERLDDFGRQMAMKDPQVDLSLVPPRLLENPEHIVLDASRVEIPADVHSQEEMQQRMLEQHDRHFLEDHIPALGGLTPRQAAQDPAQRPILIRLLKNRITNTDKQCLEQGLDYDINWLVRELGLTEILFDPPPPRARPIQEPLGTVPDLEPPPPLPRKPFSSDKAGAKMQAVMNVFETALEAEEEMLCCGSTLLDDVGEVLTGLVDENELFALMPILIQVWFVLVPPGCAAPVIEFEDFEKAFHHELELLEQSARENRADWYLDMFSRGQQPGLMTVAAGQISLLFTEGPADVPMNPRSLPYLLAALKASIDVTDKAVREQFGER